jgi:hypothetical protein
VTIFSLKNVVSIINLNLKIINILNYRILRYVSIPFFALNAGQDPHNSGQNCHNSGQGAYFRGVLTNRKIRYLRG